jgi:hypothetical protein
MLLRITRTYRAAGGAFAAVQNLPTAAESNANLRKKIRKTFRRKFLESKTLGTRQQHGTRASVNTSVAGICRTDGGSEKPADVNSATNGKRDRFPAGWIVFETNSCWQEHALEIQTGRLI